MKKEGSEGEKERWEGGKKGRGEKKGFKGEKKGCPFLMRYAWHSVFLYTTNYFGRRNKQPRKRGRNAEICGAKCSLPPQNIGNSPTVQKPRPQNTERVHKKKELANDP